ncbi:MAG: DUF3592 domain-containing protein [Candidatus Hodarchaeales archaeon]|jgi:hypothetical protein
MGFRKLDVAILIGIIINLGTAITVVQGLESQSWPTTQGTITERHTIRSGSEGPYGGPTSRAEISYNYTVEGINYTSSTASISETYFFYNIVQRGFTFTSGPGAKYSWGMIVSVHYNPNDPSMAVLETGIESYFVLYFIITWIVLLAIPIGAHKEGVYERFPAVRDTLGLISSSPIVVFLSQGFYSKKQEEEEEEEEEAEEEDILSTKYCVHCGVIINEIGTFCTNCGKNKRK